MVKMVAATSFVFIMVLHSTGYMCIYVNIIYLNIVDADLKSKLYNKCSGFSQCWSLREAQLE
jgi:hypothetical protein